MDFKNKVKSDVLQSLIDLMEEKENQGLKSKSPKFAKVDIMSDDPELANELKNKLVGKPEEEEDEEPKFPSKLNEEKFPFKEEEETPADPEEDEDMKRLLEMYKDLKG